MSTRLAIIDLDGVIADCSARFAVAEEAKQAYIDAMQKEFSIQDERGATDIYWQTVFNPAHVPLDTLIAGADGDIEQLEQRYDVIYLTSRPEHMREATYEWLTDMRLSGPRIIMKAPAFQYVKTTVWKAGMVQTLVALYRAQEVVIVEDEQANINEHLKYVSAEVQTRRIYTSLAEAVQALEEDGHGNT